MSDDVASDNIAREKPVRPLSDIEVSVPMEEEFGVRNPRKLPNPKMP